MTIYEDALFKDIDVGSIMRTGHPDIADGDAYIVDCVRKVRAEHGLPLRILDIGSGSGHLTMLLADALRDGVVIANEIVDTPIRQARTKLAGLHNAKVFDQPFETWTDLVDVVISWGSHHHLSHGYLKHVRRLLGPSGVFLVGDELCPEYLTTDDQRRLSRAARIDIVDGYIFDAEDDIKAYQETGVVPAWNLEIEQRRRIALWRWYKFVGDFAVERGAWEVLISELQIARDDLLTQFAGEHKTSPFLLERELTLAGFAIVDRKAIGPQRDAGQSCVVYVCRPPSASNRAAGAA
jgi:SAM-dependent methyltransferase